MPDGIASRKGFATFLVLGSRPDKSVSALHGKQRLYSRSNRRLKHTLRIVVPGPMAVTPNNPMQQTHCLLPRFTVGRTSAPGRKQTFRLCNAIVRFRPLTAFSSVTEPGPPCDAVRIHTSKTRTLTTSALATDRLLSVDSRFSDIQRHVPQNPR